MNKVVRFQTSDNALHTTYTEAKRHAENRYDNLLTGLATQALRQEKYVKMCEFIDANLDTFVELSRLKADILLDHKEVEDDSE